MDGDLTTLFLSIGGIFGAFALIAFASKSYSLNGIKGRTVGDGQHGTARWATKAEVKRCCQHVPFMPERWCEQARKGEQPTAMGKSLPQGIVLGCEGKKNTIAMVDSDDIHVLMIGASGVGKTAYLLYPSLCLRHEFPCAGHQGRPGQKLWFHHQRYLRVSYLGN